MTFYLGTTEILFPGKAFCLPLLLLSLFLNLSGQETNSRAPGRVYAEDNEKIVGASVALIHEPTQNIYSSITQTDGAFFFFNLKPGGPYTIVISSIGYDTLKKTNLFIHLTDGNFIIDCRPNSYFLWTVHFLPPFSNILRRPGWKRETTNDISRQKK